MQTTRQAKTMRSRLRALAIPAAVLIFGSIGTQALAQAIICPDGSIIYSGNCPSLPPGPSPTPTTPPTATPTPVPAVPSAPTLLSAKQVSSGSVYVDVAWLAPASSGSSPITGYVVTNYTSGVKGKAFAFLATSLAGRVSCASTTAPCAFNVVAVNAVGTSAPSATYTVTLTTKAIN